MAPSNSSIVVLASSKDYDNWIELIKTAALEHDVWRYVNPDLPAGLSPDQPSKPSYTDVKAPITVVTAQAIPSGPAQSTRSTTGQSESSSQNSTPSTTPSFRTPLYSDLTIDEREQYRMLQTFYVDEIRGFKKQVGAIAKLRTKIQESIDPKLISYAKAETTHAMLVKLRDRFKPTDYNRILDARARWISLQNSNKVQDIEAWLQDWETCYDECMEVKLPDVQGIWAVNALLDAIRPIHPGFAEAMSVERLRGKTHEFMDLLRDYRQWCRDNVPRVRRQHTGFTVDSLTATTSSTSSSTTSSNPPNPTLQGMDKDEKKMTCICGESHAWSKCSYNKRSY